MKYARKRDANERQIIDALVAAGCSVQQLDGAGVPDLLAGRRALVLLEVKEPGQGANRRRSEGGEGVLTAAQVKWWRAWTGPAPVIVTTPAEALAAIDEAERNLLPF